MNSENKNEQVKVRVLKTIKYNSKYFAVGAIILMSLAVFDNLKTGIVEKVVDVDLDDALDDATNNIVVDDETKLLLLDVDGVDDDNVVDLILAGFASIEDLQNAKVKDLTKIKGIGEVTANKIIDDAATFELDEDEDENSES